MQKIATTRCPALSAPAAAAALKHQLSVYPLCVRLCFTGTVCYFRMSLTQYFDTKKEIE